MTFRKQLEELKACNESLEWVKDKTIEEAWETCQNSEWMIWVLTKTDLDLIDPLCNIAEGVLHLVPEDSRLVCSNAISAARRRALKDELTNAYVATYDAATYVDRVYVSYAVESACCTADYAACAARTMVDGCIHASNIGRGSSVIARYVSDNAINAIFHACNGSWDDARIAKTNEINKQCDIFRKHFTIDQVKEAFKKLVA